MHGNLGKKYTPDKLLKPLKKQYKNIVRCFCEKSKDFKYLVDHNDRKNSFTNVKHIENASLQVACKNINLCILGNDNLNNCFTQAFEKGFIQYHDLQIFGIYNFGNNKFHSSVNNRKKIQTMGNATIRLVLQGSYHYLQLIIRFLGVN